MDRPIIFSAPMVQALLAGRKTQTRRVLKPQPSAVDDAGRWYRMPNGGQSLNCHDLRFAPGDRLWVREAWGVAAIYDRMPPRDVPTDERVRYPATQELVGPRKRPSIHMPRWASRLTLHVTDVRVQRLQEISEEDAKAEGAMQHIPCQSAVSGTTVARTTWFYHEDIDGRHFEDVLASGAFEIMWGKLHGWKSWDANPWVAAISFTVERANIDSARTTP